MASCAAAPAAAPIEEYDRRFGALARLYGTAALPHLKSMHVCVIGLGGVGSWAVEALARTGVGRLTLIDWDTVCATNVNRQLHALTDSFGKKKVALLADRVAGINPSCRVEAIDDFLTLETLERYISPEREYDYVIDAIDSIKFKTAMIAHCRRHKIPIITTGGAGGVTDPTMIQVSDLARTFHDPLAAKVRSRLRKEYGFPKEPKESFGIECVFSSEQKLYPRDDGTVGHEKPGIHGISLDCRFGYGSVTFVTATFGFVAASRAVNRVLAKRFGKR